MYGEAFWERLWRSAGIQFVGLLIVASVIYGGQPKLGSPPGDLVSFYHGDRTRILIAAILFCLAFLNLMWFGAGLRSALHDAGQGGWGAAATASSAATASVLFVLMMLSAGPAVTGSTTIGFTAGLNDLHWAGFVILCFPLAMFVMSSAFGLWRAGVISNRFFGIGVAIVILALLGGTTWARNGFWAPDGMYSHAIAPGLAVIWIAVVSGLLVRRSGVAASSSTARPAVAK
jgi:hypothetical protein